MNKKIPASTSILCGLFTDPLGFDISVSNYTSRICRYGMPETKTVINNTWPLAIASAHNKGRRGVKKEARPVYMTCQPPRTPLLRVNPPKKNGVVSSAMSSFKSQRY